MLVFVDESGDPGFKVSKGSSPAFVVAMVAFSQRAVALEVQAAIEAAAKQHKVFPEFKFSKSRPEIRDAFFDAMSPFDFCVRAIVVQKDRIQSGYLRSNKEAFYSFFVKSMLKFDNGLLKDAKIVIDGSGERLFKQELSGYLRRHTERGAINSVRFSDSRSDRLVQLADMCTGAIARSYRNNRDDAGRWRQMLKGKIEDVWDFR
ncbi:DUF3800 domain-containing protein [Mesorhizobium argentiipisi]|uniref:DUF3800 domain-containing protein n=1 Tax=Mesorhizobium argentiipisi TaxID=3015175 RepID=A0ABU8KP97_9HYPH